MRRPLEARGAQIEVAADGDVRARRCSRLGERGIGSLLLEGGAALHAAAWDEGLVDFVRLYVTPHVLGAGRRAAPGRPGRSSGGAASIGASSRSGRRLDRGICSRASLKPSANWSSASRRAADSVCGLRTPLAPELKPGDSLAVNGVCLTVILAREPRGARGRRAGDACGSRRSASLARGSARQSRAAAARRQPLRRTFRAGPRRRDRPRRGAARRRRVPLADRQLSAAARAATSSTRDRSPSTASA